MSIHRAGHAARLILATALAAGVTLAVGTTLVPAAASPSEPDPRPVGVRIVAINPIAPQPGTQVTIEAELTNTSPEPIADWHAEIRLGYTPLRERVQLAAAADDHFDSDAVAHLTGPSPLDPGERRAVTLSFATDRAVSTMGWTSYGVYLMGFEVRGPDPDRRLLGIQNTFLPWMPGSDAPTAGAGLSTGYDSVGGMRRLGIAWLWPLADSPVLGATGEVTDPRAVDRLAPTGRIATLVTMAEQVAAQQRSLLLPAAEPDTATDPAATAPPPVRLTRRSVPVTVAVDPALIDELTTVSQPGGYELAGHGRQTQGSADAAALLTRLRRLVTPDANAGDTTDGDTSAARAIADLIAFPYGDPDLIALTADGDDALAAGALNARDAVLAKAGFAATAGTVVWPASGAITSAALDRLSAQAVVLNGDSVIRPQQPGVTPSAVTSLARPGGPVTALVSDPELDDLAATSPGLTSSVALLEQRFAAETALIAAQGSARDRVVVVTPPHDFNARGTIAGRLLSDSGLLPWLRPQTVSEALSSESSTATTDQAVLRVPDDELGRQLPADYIHTLADTAGQVRNLRDILCDRGTRSAGSDCSPDELVLPIERTLLSCASVSWRSDLAGGRRLHDEAADRLRGLLAKVRVTTAGNVPLLGQSGSIPITIANDLPVPVSVRLAITTPNSSQLQVDDNRLYVVPPGTADTHPVHARTSSAGRAVFPIYVQLQTPAHKPVGPAVQIIVRSRAYGFVAVAITVGALGLLFTLAGIRVGRRLLAVRRRARAGAS